MSKIIPFEVNSMTKKKAIEILTTQKNKIDDQNYPNDENWVSQTASYIRSFFGENSNEFKLISTFKFYVTHFDPVEEEINVRYSPKMENNAKIFIDNCIETLTVKGIYKEPNVNFLYKMTDQGVIGLISLICIPVFSAGYFCGNYFAINKVDAQKIEMKKKIDSLNKLLPIPFSKPSDFKTNSKKESSIKTKS